MSSTTGREAEARGWPPLTSSSSPEVASRPSMSTQLKTSPITHHRRRIIVKPDITVIIRAPVSSSDRRHLLHPRPSPVGIIIVSTDAKSKTLLFYDSLALLLL